MQNQVLELAKHRLTPAKNLKFLKRTKDQLISVKALEIRFGKMLRIQPDLLKTR